MSAEHQYREVFDLLSEKQFHLGDDPELAALHMSAAKHFTAAADYRYENETSKAEYELEMAEQELERIEGINEYMVKAPRPDEFDYWQNSK